jgi:CheY-like chemotaxis protein
LVTKKKSKVLIIDGDEWVASLLGKFLSERGYEVFTENLAKTGLARAIEVEPDCIVCNVTLPDVEGLWVARRVRLELSKVSKTPFLFLTDERDKKARLQALNVGADVYLQRPYTHEEVVAQIEALVGMVQRLRESEPAPPLMNEPSSRTIGIIFKGDIARMGVPTVMTMLEMERRTGELLVESDDGRIAIFFFGEGACTGARFQNRRALVIETLRYVLEWKTGKFTFMVTDAPSGADVDSPVGIGHLLIEAARLNDEANKG